MKIVQLTAENIKKIKVVEITPDGSVVQITGANGSGKSSVLDAIYFALAGTRGIDSKPVRTGTGSAIVRLDLGDVKVTRRFTEAGGTSLVVEAENGARFPSPQKMLDEMLGALTFDPLAFSRMSAKEQFDTLRGMVKLDIDIDALDAENAKDYEARTAENRRAKELEAQRDAIDVPIGLLERVDEAALLDRMSRASEVNSGIENERRRREERLERIVRLRERVADLGDQLADAREILQKEQEVVSQQAPLSELEDVTEIRAAIDRARQVNAQIAQRERWEEVDEALDSAQEHAGELSLNINRRMEQRHAAIARADMPIDGLSFGEGEVLYDGVPFTQASSAEQLRASVAIAMAANPKLRVLRIKDGSLLDERSLKLIAEAATENDYQVWMEVVNTNGKIGIEMVDGEVASINGVASNEVEDLPHAVIHAAAMDEVSEASTHHRNKK